MEFSGPAPGSDVLRLFEKKYQNIEAGKSDSIEMDMNMLHLPNKNENIQP